MPKDDRQHRVKLVTHEELVSILQSDFKPTPEMEKMIAAMMDGELKSPEAGLALARMVSEFLRTNDPFPPPLQLDLF